jgi:hypothetical protein
MTSSPSLADDPMDLVIPVVGTVVNQINTAVNQVYEGICVGDVCVKPPRDPCDTFPDLPGVCVPVVVGPCTVGPNAELNCDPVEPPNPCDTYPVPYVCDGTIPPTDPCDYVPGLPGVCGPLPPTGVGTEDTTSAQVAIAVGNITQNLGVVPGNPNAMVNLLGYCQHYLDEFLGNTEYLGPLLDYGSCLDAGAVPAVIATLPQVTGSVRFLAGACSIVTSAFEDSNLTFVDFAGTTDCRAGFGAPIIFRPTVRAQATLNKFLRQDPILVADEASGLSYARSNGQQPGSIWDADSESGTAKVILETWVTPESAVCLIDGVCGFTWVVLPDKNPDTGTSISCSSSSAGALHCRSTGIPMTDSTIAHH